MIHDDVLYKKAIDRTSLRCMDKEQKLKLLTSFHNEACGGNFSSTVTVFKILRQCYYYPRMFKDAYKWVANYDKSRIFTGKPLLDSLPLRLVIIEAPFDQWGLGFIGLINPPSSQGNVRIKL